VLWNVHMYDLGDLIFLVILAPNINVFVQQQISVSESIRNRIEFIMAVVSYEMYFISEIK